MICALSIAGVEMSVQVSLAQLGAFVLVTPALDAAIDALYSRKR